MAGTDSILLTGCTVVDCAVAGRKTAGGAILVRGGKIAAVGQAAEVEAAAGRDGDEVRRVELAGAHVLPGLFDAHVHLGDVVPPHSSAYASETASAHMVRCVRKAQDNLRAGITSVRSLGERFDADVTLRDLIDGGVIEGPRVFASGDVSFSAMAIDAGEIRRHVRRLARLGVDQIKLLGSGGIPTRSRAGICTPFLGRSEVAAAVEEAGRFGLPVVLHAMGDETVAAGIAAGVRTIEHGFAMSEAMVPLLAAAGTALCPNLVVTESWRPGPMEQSGDYPSFMVRNAAEAASGHHDVVRACIAAGVRLLAGADDLPEPEGPFGLELAGGRVGLVRELELMVLLGASPGEALRAATAHPAWAVGREADLGTLEVGKTADLLVVGGDPLADLSMLERPLQVWKGGRLAVDEHGGLLAAPDRRGWRGGRR